MPDQKISVDTAVTTPADSDTIPVVQGGANKRATRAQIGGMCKVAAADQVVTDSTTLVNDTALVVTLVAGKTYAFQIEAEFDAVLSSGVKVSLAGTATHTDLIARTLVFEPDGPSLAVAFRITAAGQSDTTSGAEFYHVSITGSTTVNAGGTFLFQFAQATETVAAETITRKRGAWMRVVEAA